jgi:hypothetical protein
MRFIYLPCSQGKKDIRWPINVLTFGAYNRSFVPNRTDFHWRNEQIAWPSLLTNTAVILS